MLKTNSKKARENVRNWILANYHGPECYDNAPDADDGATFAEIAQWIYCTFKREKFTPAEQRYYRYNEFAAFSDWCAGLPSALACMFFVRPAIPVVAALLDETPAEAARYTEPDAEKLLVKLIWRELCAVL